MNFKKWLQFEEYKKDADKSRRIAVGKKERQWSQWAPRREIWSMKKK